MNPNFKKKKPLPYKNLGELYVETAYHEPSISRLVSVLLEDGTVEVISQDTSSPEAPAQDYKVDKDYFNNEIKPRLALGRPEGIEVRNVIKNRLADLNALNFEKTTDIYQEFIVRMGIKLNGKSAKKFGDALTGDQVNKNTFSNLLKTTYDLEDEPSSTGALWYDVFNAMPDTNIYGRAGEGELFISFFSDTKRPPTGDVKIEGVKIEVKGLEGRLYKAAVTKDKLPSAEVFNGSSTLGLSGYNDPDKINIITNFIINLAGGGDGRDGTLNNQNDIKKIVTDNLQALKVEIYNRNRYVTVRATPLLAQIVGAQHLLLYKQAQGFKNFLIFNKSLDSSGSIFFICFKVPDTLLDMFNIFNQNNISIRTVTSDQSGHKILWPVS